MAEALSLFEKIWRRHVVIARPDGYTLLHVDRQLLHDGSWQAFEKLAARGIKMRRPDRHFATPDHFTSTAAESIDAIDDPIRRRVVDAIVANTAREGVQLFGLGDPRRGIVHVVGPEQGITQPGLLMVCGDSHTATHGALGALAFGIGASEVAHVMATQAIWQKKPKTMRITVDGRLGPGIVAKDVILAIIARIGAGGGVGHVLEYAGAAIRGLSIEGRLTLCNMSIEAGARAGMVAPDEKTFAYLEGRPFAPKGDEWRKAMDFWRGLPSDPGAMFDAEVTLDGDAIAPMVTWGTSPEDAAPVTATVPDPSSYSDAVKQEGVRRALDYMGLKAGQKLTDIAVDRVFIGSCTNARIEDLRAAAAVAKGRRAVVRAWAVPGSGLVKRQAEAEGLDRIFRDAGFEWREPGCSMCVGMNGDTVDAGQRCASTSNRNFVGRQGPGARTHLMSPAMAAAAAVTGRFTDVRKLGAA
ncbi:3-isopropylmalate dehydratase large subunit [Desertibaculum subflavum]|uniref:3-isopropylmalate dehydratase large subunit n=1 Tax=Desertibaculum subflavum TaxID=2268458 RepID=UPI000E66644C